MKHKANLDILRALAVCAVLIQHFAWTVRAFGEMKDGAVARFCQDIGHAGVLAFFVHTSLVLMYSLQRMHQSMGRITLQFYVRRFFRIYPLAIFAIVLALLFHLPDTPWGLPSTVPGKVILANLSLTQNIFTKVDILAPLWSLPYEVQMYLMLPGLFFLASLRRGAIYIAVLLAAFCALVTILVAVTGHPKLFAYVPCFLSGVLCYSLRNRISAAIPAVWWPVSVVALIFVHRLVSMRGVAQHWVDWIFCILLGLGINFFRDSTAERVNFAASKIALYSYGIYLLHDPVLYLIFARLRIQNPVLGISLVLPIIAAASILTFYGLESPFIELGRRLTSNGYRKSLSAAEDAVPAP